MDGFGGIDAVTDTWYQQFGSWCAILTNHQYIGVWIWTTIIRSHATHQECAIRITPIFEGQWFISVCSLDVLPTKYCLPFEMWTRLFFLEHLVSSISQRTCLFRYVRSWVDYMWQCWHSQLKWNWVIWWQLQASNTHQLFDALIT